MRSNQDYVFVVGILLTIAGLVYTMSPLGKVIRPDIQVRATLSK